MEKPDLEALKELLRVFLLAVIPVMIDSLSQGEINPRLLILTASIALLRALDKWLHTLGKEEDDESLSKGLTRF
jgi:hypothetical protein